MLLIWMTGVVLLGAGEGARICFKLLGCFSDAPPWGGTPQRPITMLPWDPATINTRFQIFTRDNPDTYQEISAVSSPAISSSNFHTARKTRIIIHGFRDSAQSSWVPDMCRELLRAKDENCIAVDWSAGADTNYAQAATNLRVVGAEIAYLIDFLSKNFSYPLSNIQLIGSSLGAQLAGEVGKRKSGIGRITGLEPAGPYFRDTPSEVRLDLSDADFVDVIHTDSASSSPNLGLEMSEAIGHMDFFPNGGVHMPGCPLNTEGPPVNVDEISNSGRGSRNFLSCNHQKAIFYYTQSISNASLFVSHPCANWSTYQKGNCKTCPSAGCPKMGHYADTYHRVNTSSQVFYLYTD